MQYQDLTPRQISEQLMKLPHQIGKAAQEVAHFEKQLELAKHNLNVARAKAFLGTSKNKTVKEREAEQALDDEVLDGAVKEIETMANLKVKDIELEELNNKFIAMRKVASLRETEFKSIGD